MNEVQFLNEQCQKMFGEPIRTSVDSVEIFNGKHYVTISIILPTGEVFTATGNNKKEAKIIAAKEAIEVINLDSLL